MSREGDHSSREKEKNGSTHFFLTRSPECKERKELYRISKNGFAPLKKGTGGVVRKEEKGKVSFIFAAFVRCTTKWNAEKGGLLSGNRKGRGKPGGL